MNTREKFIEGLGHFFSSDERVLLVTGTHQYYKHKVIVAYLDKMLKNSRIHFRTNGMDNLCENGFMGFAGLKRKPVAGEIAKIHNNHYVFDSFNSRTWVKTTGNNVVSIIYPIDAILRDKRLMAIIEDVLERSSTKIVVLVSWTDHIRYDYNELSMICDRHLVYDAEEEDPEYHKRVLEIISKQSNL